MCLFPQSFEVGPVRRCRATEAGSTMDSIVQTWIEQGAYTGSKSGISGMYKGDDILKANSDNS